VFEAVYQMVENRISHLALHGKDHKVYGLIDFNELFKNQIYSSTSVMNQIHEALSVKKLIDSYKKIPFIVYSLMDCGFTAENVMRLISNVNDLLIKKTVEFAIKKEGEPPVLFNLIVFGSLARREQTLFTDQDNALIFEDSENNYANSEYFLRLGENICDTLNEIGFSYCEGNTMAKNPLLNLSLSGWKKKIAERVKVSDAKDVLDMNIYFDLRSVYGDGELVKELRKTVFEISKNESVFVNTMARECAQIKLPIDIFGKLITGINPEHPHKIDLKSAIMPLINTARVLSIHFNIYETETIKRLEALKNIGILIESDYTALKEAFNFLIKQRLQSQKDHWNDFNEGLKYQNPKELSEFNQIFLKKSLSQISLFQNKLSYYFTTGK